jgi:serine/threonine protein kinase
MKTFVTLTTKSKNSSFNEFIGYLNVDIDSLNRLITEYNAAPDHLKKELLIEIYYHHQYMVERYAGDSLATERDVAEVLYESMYREIQKEFRAQGIDNINNFTVSEFDRTSSLMVAQSTDLIKLASMLNGSPDAIQHFVGELNFQYKKNIHRLVQNTAKEDNPEKMYRDLVQLKRIIRLYLATIELAPERANQLRNLLFAINTKLSYLEQVYPDDIIKKPVAPQSLPDVISGMSPTKATKLVLELSKGASFKPENLAKLYHPKDKGYAEFLLFLGTHRIEFLGGNNSKNFKVIENTSGVEWVLKIENRLGVPREVETYLADNALSGTLTTTYVSRPTVITKSYKKINSKTGDEVNTQKTETRGLVVTEFCRGGDLESHGKKIKDGKSRLSSAYDIYSQMGEIFEKVRLSGNAFPDPKNTNWLIDENGVLKIADGKSFLSAPGGVIDNQQRYYHLIRTRYMKPPEMRENTINVDAMHAYMLGKNLYQYVSGCSDEYLAFKHEGTDFDFSSDAFQTASGKDLIVLIRKLVKTNPSDRLSVAAALKELRALEAKEFKDLFDNCSNVLQKLIVIDPDLKTSNYQDKLTDASDIQELLKLKKELDEILEDDQAELKSIKKSCRKILDDITQLDPDSDLDGSLHKKISAVNDLHSAFTLTYELRKIECRTMAKCIDDIDDNKLSGSLKAKVKDLDKQEDTATINKLMTVLKKKYAAVLPAQQRLRQECFELTMAMDQYKIKADDPLMFAYRGQLEDQIFSTASLKSLSRIHAELQHQLEVMDSSVAKQIKGIIARYRTESKSFFSSGKKNKAEQIEIALLNVPVELRGKIFSIDPEYKDLPELVAVRVALGKSGSTKVEKASRPEVDEKKAPSSFHTLKGRVREFKDSEEDKADSSVFHGKGKGKGN